MPSPAEIKRLDKKISELMVAISEAERGNNKHLKELLLQIHKKGWTTIAELAFVHNILDSVKNQVSNINEQVGGLAKGAGKVGFD
jgi:hypothetical protein